MSEDERFQLVGTGCALPALSATLVWFWCGTIISMVVLIGGEKGGTGKSTIATNLAAYLADRNDDVVLLDADAQATASRWVERRNNSHPELPKVHCVQKTGDIFETIRELSTRYQQVIIDAGGRDSEELRSAMVAAQKLYTPLKASQPDLETTMNINQLVRLACGLNPSLKAYAVISMAPTHPAITETQEAFELLMELPEIKLSRVFIRERKIFRDAMVEGKGVIECKNRKAKAEIELLAGEIYDG